VTTETWKNTHTYSYLHLTEKNKGGTMIPNSANFLAYQGFHNSDQDISDFAMIPMNSAIVPTLTGQTIHAATLTATNFSSYDKTGAYMILGFYNLVHGAPGNYHCPQPLVKEVNMFPWTASGSPGQWFHPKQTRTFQLPAAFLAAYIAHNGAGLLIGDNNSNLKTQHNYLGIWYGLPGSFVLAVSYSA
jgi:hypothetical protein